MAKQAGGTAAQVEALVRPVVEALGLQLWDVRFEKEGPEWYLRVLIERTDGTYMDTDTCELASRAIDPVLDEADLIDQSYYLEVGSAGLGRRLLRPEHFAFAQGQQVRASLYRALDNGDKTPAGVLLGVQNDVASLQTDTGVLEIPLKDAAYFKLCDDEDLFPNQRK